MEKLYNSVLGKRVLFLKILIEFDDIYLFRESGLISLIY